MGLVNIPVDEDNIRTSYGASTSSVHTKPITRPEILDAAKACVCGDREQDYGNMEDNFLKIAMLWEAYLDHHIEPEDVAAMMCLLKIARISSGRAKVDNWIDMAGYAACGGEIEGKTEAEK